MLGIETKTAVESFADLARIKVFGKQSNNNEPKKEITKLQAVSLPRRSSKISRASRKTLELKSSSSGAFGMRNTVRNDGIKPRPTLRLDTKTDQKPR
jgi:hypothetical protein